MSNPVTYHAFAKVLACTSLAQFKLPINITGPQALSNFTSCQCGPSLIITEQLHMPFVGPQCLIKNPVTYVCTYILMFVLHKYKYSTNICFPIICTLTNYSLLFMIVYRTTQTRFLIIDLYKEYLLILRKCMVILREASNKVAINQLNLSSFYQNYSCFTACAI